MGEDRQWANNPTSKVTRPPLVVLERQPWNMMLSGEIREGSDRHLTIVVCFLFSALDHAQAVRDSERIEEGIDRPDGEQSLQSCTTQANPWE